MQSTPVTTSPSIANVDLQPLVDTSSTSAKEQMLRRMMREMRQVLVAYSGGVDSTYLAFIAHDELGKDAVCILGTSPSVSEHQRAEAISNARLIGLDLETVSTDEIGNEDYVANPSNRCYFCKTELYAKLNTIAQRRNIRFILDGTNADDLLDIRPGRVAAGERGVRSPLAEAGLSKDEIRKLSRDAGLPTWEKPSSPCLSSRIAYGVPVTIERLSKIERAERMIRDMGFREFRVRVHDDLARVEISPSELENALNMEFADLVSEKLSKIGFKYVTLDLKGFRSGSLN